MAVLRAEIKRGFLRSLFRQSEANAVTLEAALGAFQDQGFKAIKAGKLVIASSGAGHSVQFAVPDAWRSFSQEEVFSLSEELFQVFDDAKAMLIANGTAEPDDDSIYTAMTADDRLQTVTSLQKDNSPLRFPARY